jgi:serpin B
MSVAIYTFNTIMNFKLFLSKAHKIYRTYFYTNYEKNLNMKVKYDMKEQFSQLGMKQVFTYAADLSEIDGKKDFKVSKAIHKAVIGINEEGSEAAAATAHWLILTSLSPGLFEFKADRPFIFFIIDNRNGMILFIGLINEL